MASPGERRQRLIEKFQVVARQRIAHMAQIFDRLECQGPETQLAQELMREIHTVKGEARLLGFGTISDISHLTEDLLRSAEDQAWRIDGGCSDLVLFGLDLMSGYLDETSDEATLTELRLKFELRTKEFLAAATADPAAQDSDPASAAAAPPEPSLASPELPAPPFRSVPDPDEREPESAPARQDTVPAQPVADAALADSPEVERAKPVQACEEEELVRIAGRHLAELTGMASVLMLRQELTRRMLNDLFDRARKDRDKSGSATDRSSIEILRQLREESFETLLRLGELQERIRQMRLLRIENIFEKYPPAIRDLAREQGKRVRVLTEGSEVVVDKQVLEQIDDALLHLVRNSVDHGLEDPEERRAAGKPLQATVTLKARQLDSWVSVSVSDDGRGLDIERVKEAAIRRALLTSVQAEMLADEDALQLIFHSGFSTRTEITDISGRGVGLNAVKDRVESMGGSIRLSTQPGAGSNFEMVVPISVALTKVLLFSWGKMTYGVSAALVASVQRVPASEVENFGSGRAILVDGSRVPLIEAGQLLGEGASAPEGEDLDIVLVEHSGQRLGIRVEKLLEEKQVVQRPLGRFFDAARLMVGTVVLEGGAPAIILNVAELLRQFGKGELRLVSYKPQPGASDARPRRLLIVDDSELTRDMLVSAAERLGFEPTEAVNGQDALHKIRMAVPDLILTDLDMPVMNGFELLEAVRRDPAARDRPVVVLSSRGSDSDVKRALNAGASAYLVKASFSDAVFRDTLQRFLPET